MDNLNVLTIENNQVNVAKPPPRVCPRCNSNKTKFCYYNNYTTSQPRYSCKNCRRYWTHGGALRNVPIGGSCRKVKRARVDQSISRMVSAGIQQVNHQPFSYVKQNNEFVESIGSSSSAVVGNHLGSLSEIHGSMVTKVSPIQSFQPNHSLDFHDGTFEQGYYDVGSDSPFINLSFGGYVDNHNGYHINQVNQDKWSHSFNNTTNMNHNASTSGSRESDINMNNESNKNRYKDSVIRHPCHLEKHDPC